MVKRYQMGNQNP